MKNISNNGLSTGTLSRMNVTNKYFKRIMCVKKLHTKEQHAIGSKENVFEGELIPS